MPARRRALDPPLPQAGTRVGNRKAILPGIDGRTAGARRYRELVSELCLEITQMKRRPTTAEEMLARRAALIVIWCENAEARMAKGEAVDIGEFTDATNTLRRTLTDAGLIWPAHLRIKM